MDYEALIKAIPHQYLILSNDFNIIECNELFTKGTMTVAKEIIGRNLFDVFPENPADLDTNGMSALRASLISALENKEPDIMPLIKYSIKIPGTDQFEERYWTVNNTPILDDDGSVLYILNSSTDVTNFVHAQVTEEDRRKLLEHTNKIESEIYRNARILEESELHLKQSNEALDEFAYIASHDLKEPLRGISNYSSYLMEDYGDKLDDEGKLQLQTIQKLSARLESLLNNLLTFSRISRVDLDFTDCNLNSIINDILLQMEKLIESNHAIVTIPHELPIVVCDAARITMVLECLITNAIQYNTKEQKTVVIDFEEQNDKFIFSIADNGIGIHKYNFDIIFTIFKRLHRRDEFGGGAGAGLTLAKRIIERHNGTIWLESIEGIGTTIYFSIEKKKGTHI